MANRESKKDSYAYQLLIETVGEIVTPSESYPCFEATLEELWGLVKEYVRERQKKNWKNKKDLSRRAGLIPWMGNDYGAFEAALPRLKSDLEYRGYRWTASERGDEYVKIEFIGN